MGSWSTTSDSLPQRSPLLSTITTEYQIYLPTFKTHNGHTRLSKYSVSEAPCCPHVRISSPATDDQYKNMGGRGRITSKAQNRAQDKSAMSVVYLAVDENTPRCKVSCVQAPVESRHTDATSYRSDSPSADDSGYDSDDTEDSDLPMTPEDCGHCEGDIRTDDAIDDILCVSCHWYVTCHEKCTDDAQEAHDMTCGLLRDTKLWNKEEVYRFLINSTLR